MIGARVHFTCQSRPRLGLQLERRFWKLLCGIFQSRRPPIFVLCFLCNCGNGRDGGQRQCGANSTKNFTAADHVFFRHRYTFYWLASTNTIYPDGTGKNKIVYGCTAQKNYTSFAEATV